ncbi:DoxX family membrane protein [Paenibacillus sp. SYP-B3998]|uniref:DoxX family membrane protein n=2 Tax=Paenibacillus sp. SYP-B3998 TaxID=2678564 RepID=A0A6G4A4G4_9BACL|nr:DoxX family membrane protein [Paenibacillus sp. SYP-B3998]
MNWLRGSKLAAAFLTLMRLYLGVKWVMAGWHKITGEKAFDASGFLSGAIAKPVLASGSNDMLYVSYVSFLKNFALPNVGIFNVIVPWGEFLVGLGLLLGALTTTAIFFGLFMNFMYIFSGTVSSNPWFILLGFIVIAAGANAGKFGMDYWILPILRGWFDNLLISLRVKPKYLPSSPND